MSPGHTWQHSASTQAGVDCMLPRYPLLCNTGLDSRVATRAQDSPQGRMLGETESGDPWRESLPANEAPETEFELFGGFRKVRAEACLRGFKAQAKQ